MNKSFVNEPWVPVVRGAHGTQRISFLPSRTTATLSQGAFLARLRWRHRPQREDVPGPVV